MLESVQDPSPVQGSPPSVQATPSPVQGPPSSVKGPSVEGPSSSVQSTPSSVHDSPSSIQVATPLFQEANDTESSTSNQYSQDVDLGTNKWSISAVHRLIDLYQESEAKFTSVKYKKKEIWADITKKLQGEGFIDKSITSVQVQQKWKNVSKKYRDTVDHNNTSGNNRKSCPFYERLHEVLGHKPKVQPKVLACSSSGVIKPSIEKKKRKFEGKIYSSSDENDASLPSIIHRRPRKKVKSNVKGEISTFRQEQNKNQQQLLETIKKMHEDRMRMFESFLDVLKKES
ncbi:trihelix transcription factor GTL1-like isoform X2 [Haliotis rubra]|uniref:trihelix transcription factor GTL1-like isoform X2 n=1 Tax=Haliotis rubra TaxID=36100 RepID=UPI001EE5FD81|nr:trihelix transcription factor GTL1-like isoform X2 [Haliotis rubra]